MADSKREGFKSNEALIGKIQIQIGEEKKEKGEAVVIPAPLEVPKVLEDILVKEVGPIGRYQKWRILMMGILLVMLASCAGEVNFTTARIDKRCFIPECEDPVHKEFSSNWLPLAIPRVESWMRSVELSFLFGIYPSLDSCRRFVANSTPYMGYKKCSTASFDREHTLPCDLFLYKNNLTIDYALALGCNEWQRSLIGMSRMAGCFWSFILTKHVVRYMGWRQAILLGTITSACFGVSRLFVVTYTNIVGAQFMEGVLSTAIQIKISIFAIELVGSKYKNMVCCILLSCIFLGHMWLTLLAWLLQDWMALTGALYLPLLCYSLLYLWTMDESFNWHVRNVHVEQAEALLQKVAKTNGTKLSEKSLLSIRAAIKADKRNICLQKSCANCKKTLLGDLLKDKLVLMRCLILPLWWTATYLIDYGLMINSLYLPGNMYCHYAAVTAASALGMWIGLKKTVTKRSKLNSLWMCGLLQFICFLRECGNNWVGLVAYLMSKFCISVIRMMLLSRTKIDYCDETFKFYYMLGQLGVIVATLTPALGYEFDKIQFLMFSILALICSSLIPVVHESFFEFDPAVIRDDIIYIEIHGFGKQLPGVNMERSGFGKRLPGVDIERSGLITEKPIKTPFTPVLGLDPAPTQDC